MIKFIKNSTLSILILAMTASNVLAMELPSFAPLAKKASPAVVNISTERVVQGNNFNGNFFGMPPEMERFFKQFDPFFGGGDNQRQRMQNSLGTGFIISSDGYIVTNNHVVEGASKILINFQDSDQKLEDVEAKLIGTDPETDIALLKINVKRSLPVLRFGNSDALEVGDWVVAIGNPFGLSSTVTAGIVSAKGRDIQSGPYDSFLQTDASINPGNSGGPLINLKGEVVGINTAIAASGQGIGFAIPSKLASSVVDQLKSGNKVSRGWIGVSVQDLDELTAKALGLKEGDGALIANVMPNEPAEKAGMRSGDVVIKIGNTKISNASELTRAIGAYKPNSQVEIVALRNGRQLTFNVKLGERNVTGQATAPQSEDKSSVSLGITVRSLNAEDRQTYRLSPKMQGVIVLEVERNGLAAQSGIRKNDIILEANLKPVPNASTLGKIIESEGLQRGAVVLLINRQGTAFMVTIPLAKK